MRTILKTITQILLLIIIHSCSTKENSMLQDGYAFYEEFKDGDPSKLEKALKTKGELNNKYPHRAPISVDSLKKIIKIIPEIDGFKLSTDQWNIYTPQTSWDIETKNTQGLKNYKFIELYYKKPNIDRIVFIKIHDLGAHNPWSLATDWDLLKNNKVKRSVFTDGSFFDRWDSESCKNIPNSIFMIAKKINWFQQGSDCPVENGRSKSFQYQALYDNRILLSIEIISEEDVPIVKSVIEKVFDWHYIETIK